MAIDLKTSTKATEEISMVDLFSLDGEMFQIPEKPKVNVALKYLKIARIQGPDMAAGWLLEELLGTEAYEALMNFDDLTTDQLETVMMVAQEVTLGAMEA